jgi:cytochrome P450
MMEIIEERRLSDDKGEYHDLLSNLISASEMEDENVKLSDSELMSNALNFIIAGHEVSSVSSINIMLTSLNADNG